MSHIKKSSDVGVKSKALGGQFKGHVRRLIGSTAPEYHGCSFQE